MAIVSPHRSDAQLLVLHGLRLKGIAEAHVLAERVGLDEPTVRQHLAEFEVSEQVRRRDGRLSGWSLTPAGRAENERMLRAELDDVDGRAVVSEQYERFRSLNVDFLGLCTLWQLRDVEGNQVLNDHSDPRYDREIVESLESMHAEAVPICDELRRLLQRFDRYRDRFGSALGRVRAGETDWFTKPILDSYHTVWFELHEDFLATLGMERSKEAS